MIMYERSAKDKTQDVKHDFPRGFCSVSWLFFFQILGAGRGGSIVETSQSFLLDPPVLAFALRAQVLKLDRWIYTLPYG